MFCEMKFIVILLIFTVASGWKLNNKLQEYYEDGRIWGIVEDNNETEKHHDHECEYSVENKHDTDLGHKDSTTNEKEVDDGRNWEFIGEEKKKAQGKWVWGLVPEERIKPNKTKNEKTLNGTALPYDPCQRYNPEKPNYKAQGRRISEEKCMEYLWGVWVREEKLKRLDECVKKIESDPLATNLNRDLPDSIVGGSTVYNSSEYPHMGALGWKTREDGKYVFKCGCTLISNKFVMTAAHCTRAPVDDYIIESRPTIVRFSNTDLSNVPLSYDVEIIDIKIHPNYTYLRRYYDIALMELELELIFSDIIQPACLWTKRDISELGDVAKITGWGALRFGSREASTDLQAAEVDFINSTLCDELLFTSRSKNWQGLQDHQICAGKLNGGVDTCKGDSGGPLQVVKYKSDRGALFNVVGVTSFGIACGQANLPGIYVRVSSFIDWIENIVWK